MKPKFTEVQISQWIVCTSFYFKTILYKLNAIIILIKKSASSFIITCIQLTNAKLCLFIMIFFGNNGYRNSYLIFLWKNGDIHFIHNRHSLLLIWTIRIHIYITEAMLVCPRRSDFINNEEVLKLMFISTFFNLTLTTLKKFLLLIVW